MKDEKEKNLWNIFKTSGLVSDYLNYKSTKSDFTQDNEGEDTSYFNSDLSLKEETQSSPIV